MRAIRLAAAMLVLFAAACEDSSGPDNEIEMRDNLFSPASHTVDAGTRVTWRNVGAVIHNSTSAQAGLWSSGPIAAGGTFSREFNTAGTFQYTCTLHPGMAGTIIVR